MYSNVLLLTNALLDLMTVKSVMSYKDSQIVKEGLKVGEEVFISGNLQAQEMPREIFVCRGSWVRNRHHHFLWSYIPL